MPRHRFAIVAVLSVSFTSLVTTTGETADVAPIVRNNAFQKKSKTRRLRKVGRLMGSDFRNWLRTTSSSDHILDLGAGEGVIASQLTGQREIGRLPKGWRGHHAREPRRVTAISLDFGDSPPVASRFLHLLRGRPFEDIGATEIVQPFGKVTGGLDLWGVIAYTRDLNATMQRLGEVLDVGTPFYIRTGNPNPYAIKKMRHMSGRPVFKSSMYGSVVTTNNGPESLPHLLARWPGFRGEFQEGGTVLKLTRTSAPVTDVPVTYKRDAPVISTPPHRIFERSE